MSISFAVLHSKLWLPVFTLVSYCSQSRQSTLTSVSLSVCITLEQSTKAMYKCHSNNTRQLLQYVQSFPNLKFSGSKAKASLLLAFENAVQNVPFFI